MKQLKKVTGADLIIVLFLIVTIPHTAMILSAFEYKDWGLLAWSLAGAVDIGIAYGGVISANINADKEARQWATALFVGLSVGSYSLNVAHYVAFHAGLYSIGLGAFFPIGILLLAKIKSRLHNSKQIKLENIAPAPINYTESLAARDRALLELQSQVEELQKAVSRNVEPVTLAGLVEMPELVTAGAADSGIDLTTELSNNGFSNRAATATTDFPEAEVKEILGRLYAQGDRRIKTPDAMKLIKNIWKDAP